MGAKAPEPGALQKLESRTTEPSVGTQASASKKQASASKKQVLHPKPFRISLCKALLSHFLRLNLQISHLLKMSVESQGRSDG